MANHTPDLDQEKWETIHKLNTPEGRRSFMGTFEVRLANYKKLIEKGGGFLVRGEVEDMKATADQIRDQEPEAARFIDEAREKVEELLKNSSFDNNVAA